MNRHSKIKKQRKDGLTKQAKLIWSKAKSPFSRPQEALWQRAKSDDSFRKSLWAAWHRAVEKKGDQLVGIFRSNFPPSLVQGDGRDHIFFISAQEFSELSKSGVTQDHVECLKRFLSIFNPPEFEAYGTIPPIFVLWSDGEVEGDFISDICLMYPIEFGGDLIEAGGNPGYYK